MLRKGQNERALRYFEAAQRAGLETPRLLYATASCYSGLELPGQAIRTLNRLFERAPDHARAHRLLAVCYDKLGDRERANQAYQRADWCAERERSRRGAAAWSHDVS
jgi:predicted Zn-dependent protease